MPKPRQDYAIVEWDFIRFDPRYRSLPVDQARAYLHLWVTCLHLRRDSFTREEIEGEMLPDMCGVDRECFASMVGSSIASRLLTRGPGGRIKVGGVRGKHEKLRNWNAKPLRALCGTSLSERGEERRGEDKRGESDSSEPSEQAPEPVPSPVVFTFESDLLVGQGEGPWHVTQKIHDGWVVAYPDLVHLSEYRKAAEWLKANPTRRKTRRGFRRFLNHWMERAQNSPRRSDGTHHADQLPANAPGPRHFTGDQDDRAVYEALDAEARERARASQPAQEQGPA